ncbi:SIS domain-containing protein [Limnohabitans sp. yimb22184]|uniref:D-sedoheptulose-7-phosphate isomerase n=1 Tax=Limnohabitans sp. YIMB22184 TaxID=3374104 RepID=UPI003A875C43
MNPELLAKNMAEHEVTIHSLTLLSDLVLEASRILASSLKSGGKLMLCGNGGSASDAQHFAAEMMGRFQKSRQPYAAIALTSDTSILTCIANDYAFDQIFARQVQGLGRSGDVLIALSTSGHSANVIRAAIQARQSGVFVLGLTGKGGGALKSHCDLCLVVESANTARIQEAHILLIHTLCELVEQGLSTELLAL